MRVAEVTELWFLKVYRNGISSIYDSKSCHICSAGKEICQVPLSILGPVRCVCRYKEEMVASDVENLYFTQLQFA